MKVINYIFLLIFISTNLLAQVNKTEVQRLEYLEEADTLRIGNIYVQLDVEDSMNRIVLFLVNKSNTTLRFYGESGQLYSSIEFKNKKGDWQQLQRALYCGTGLEYGQYVLPTKSYTWTFEEIKLLNEGDFSTEIRYSVVVNNKTIYSKPISAKINSARLLGYPYSTALLAYDPEEILNQEKLSDSDKRKVLNHAQIYLFKAKEFIKSIRLTKKLLARDPNYHKARILLAQTYLRQVKEASKANQYTLLSQAILECRKIPKGDDSYNQAQELITKYQEFLPTKSEWLELAQGSSQIVNGKFYYQVNMAILEGSMEILFQNK